MMVLAPYDLHHMLRHSIMVKACSAGMGNDLFSGRAGILLLLFETAGITGNNALNHYAFHLLENRYQQISACNRETIKYGDWLSLGWLIAEGCRRDYFDVDVKEACHLTDQYLVWATGQKKMPERSFEECVITLLYARARWPTGSAIQKKYQRSISHVWAAIGRTGRNAVGLPLAVVWALYPHLKMYIPSEHHETIRCMLNRHCHDQQSGINMAVAETATVTRLLLGDHNMTHKAGFPLLPAQPGEQELREIAHQRIQQSAWGLQDGVAGIAALVLLHPTIQPSIH